MSPSERRFALISFACAVALAFSGRIAPHLPIDPTIDLATARAVFAFAFGSVVTMVLLTAASVPSPGRTTFVSAILALGTATTMVIAKAPTLLTISSIGWAILHLGAALGASVGARIEHRGHLLVVAWISSLADAFSVFFEGAPSQALAEDSSALTLFAISFPVLGTERLDPILGAGDVVMSALYVSAARRHDLSVARTIVALALGFTATLLALFTFERPLPALPFLGVAFVLAHARLLRLRYEDRSTAGLSFVVGLALLALAAWMASR